MCRVHAALLRRPQTAKSWLGATSRAERSNKTRSPNYSSELRIRKGIRLVTAVIEDRLKCMMGYEVSLKLLSAQFNEV